jgi:replicative DNA helicase
MVSGKMEEAPFFIVDMPNMELRSLRTLARKLCSKEGIKIIFIDYLGLIGYDSKLVRHEQISFISRSLKSLARELKIPIVVLCQLNREMERTGLGQPPTLANLRDSGSIEQDADLVMFLHKKQHKKGEEPQDETDGIPTELIIAKQRNGPIGKIELIMHSKYTRFVSQTKEHKPQ